MEDANKKPFTSLTKTERILAVIFLSVVMPIYIYCSLGALIYLICENEDYESYDEMEYVSSGPGYDVEYVSSDPEYDVEIVEESDDVIDYYG